MKRAGAGVRIVGGLLPSKSPWLNPSEPKWRHGKRKVVEPDGLLDAAALEGRVCKCFGCAQEPHLALPQEVAWFCTSASSILTGRFLSGSISSILARNAVTGSMS